MKNIITLIIAVFTITAVQAQTKKNSTVETTFKVDGVCMMCKKRIESAALRTKGVKMAEWDKESKDLKVVYNTKKISQIEIKQAIANQGHETAEVPTDSTSYAKLPDCCRYKHGAKCTK